ncbi:uncharacterized protein LOC143462460 [Clavelina lepadiformis]|uniref:Uncharacterized protein n=1 Tax=Clavelina lepadiformis TaxID=159417 RepID=A0ABP0GLI0_CLALP
MEGNSLEQKRTQLLCPLERKTGLTDLTQLTRDCGETDNVLFLKSQEKVEAINAESPKSKSFSPTFITRYRRMNKPKRRSYRYQEKRGGSASQIVGKKRSYRSRYSEQNTCLKKEENTHQESSGEDKFDHLEASPAMLCAKNNSNCSTSTDHSLDGAIV